MDFALSEAQVAIRDLAERICQEQATPEALRALEGSDSWCSDDLWRALAQADLLGLSLPEADGGGGFGVLEAAIVAEQLGRVTAPVPYLATIVGAALPIAAFGDDAQRRDLLPGLVSGTTLVTPALHEPTAVTVPAVPSTTATPGEGGWRLDGTKVVVPAVDRANVVLVPARTGDTSSTVFLVDRDAPGVDAEAESAVTGEPQWTIHLDGVRVESTACLGRPDQGAQIVGWTTDRLVAVACAMQTGVCEEALALTARYVAEREQFGTKLGTFQAVAHRVADAYVDTEGVRLTALQAAWRLDAGLDAERELMIAKYWASEGAQRVVHAAQHLHGGIGMDLDYPVHRYFRLAKVLELSFGSASPTLLRLGGLLADRALPTT